MSKKLNKASFINHLDIVMRQEDITELCLTVAYNFPVSSIPWKYTAFSLRSPTLIVRHGASDASIFFIYLIASLKFSLTYLLPRALTRTRRPIRAPSRSPRLRSPALTNSNSNSNPNSSFPFVIYTVV